MIDKLDFLVSSGRPTELPSEQKTRVANELVRVEDPLLIDDKLDQIKNQIALRDAQSLAEIISIHTPTMATVDSYSLPSKIAALRDLGFLVAAYHTIEPDPQICPETTEVLVRLGSELGMPPRDTLYTYSVWNPSNSRRRSFTNSMQEETFISSITDWSNSLHAGLIGLMALNTEQLNVTEDVTEGLAYSFRQMQQAMVNVRQSITSEWFYQTLQPYFKNISIAGESYEPPSGAHMNLLLMDHLLWGADSTDTIYTNYRNHNLAYLPEGYKRLVTEENASSIYTLLKTKYEAGETPAKHVLSTLLDISTAIVSFRRVHLALAKEMLEIKFPEGIPPNNKEMLKLTALISGVSEIRNLIKLIQT